jgi:hypothetical protein
MPKLAGKRRCGIIVLAMSQRQVMLRIKKIDVNHRFYPNMPFTIAKVVQSVKKLDTF